MCQISSPQRMPTICCTSMSSSLLANHYELIRIVLSSTQLTHSLLRLQENHTRDFHFTVVSFCRLGHSDHTG
ncbi:hypothetical protein CMV_014777 [Castanea mollissima]|uniref:Uncharacterized protein n=1 Tax=Castanea mollissima TaxID=60419 RepID=A0A8J4RB54_9ROSI|nr:hypothetical protein CMV_014777 [Castanea mollissima]